MRNMRKIQQAQKFAEPIRKKNVDSEIKVSPAGSNLHWWLSTLDQSMMRSISSNWEVLIIQPDCQNLLSACIACRDAAILVWLIGNFID